MFNQVFRAAVLPVTPITKFKISAIHTELTLNDTIVVGDATSVVAPIFLLDTIFVGDAAVVVTFPLTALANRVSPPRGITRNSPLRARTRIQPLHKKEEEFDNKVRQQAQRVPE